MFQGLINSARSAASNLVVKYLARASVAIPFVIAGGFALAALTTWLSARYGAITAYWSMAGVLGLLGVIAALTVSAKENREDQEAEKNDTGATVSAATADALSQAPLAALSAVFAVPGGPGAALSAARIVGRNWPLAILFVLIGALFYPVRRSADDEASVRGHTYSPKPNGSDLASPVR